jgi:hypothetical protein
MQQSGVTLQNNYYRTERSGVRQTLPKPKRSGSSFGRVTSESPEPLICIIISYYLLLSLIISYYLLSPSHFHLELSTDRHDDSNVNGIVEGQTILFQRTRQVCLWNFRRTELVDHTNKPADRTPCERLLARDSSQDSLQETSCERLIAIDFSGRAENATTNHRWEWRR